MKTVITVIYLRGVHFGVLQAFKYSQDEVEVYEKPFGMLCLFDVYFSYWYVLSRVLER